MHNSTTYVCVCPHPLSYLNHHDVLLTHDREHVHVHRIPYTPCTLFPCIFTLLFPFASSLYKMEVPMPPVPVTPAISVGIQH